MKKIITKKITSRETVTSLLVLVEMGKARIVKEHTDAGPEYAVFSASNRPLGVIDARLAYLFENVIQQHGSGDGLFDRCSQTVSR